VAYYLSFSYGRLDTYSLILWHLNKEYRYINFCLYFAFWHAIPSLSDQFYLLFGTTSFRSVTTYMRQSAVFWALSVIGLAAVFSLVYFENKTPLPLLVYFLAAITFPHVIVMSSVENALKRA